MLRELCELATREELVGDPAFEMRPLAWVITLKEDGECLGIQSTHEPESTDGKSKRKPKEVAKKVLIPRQFMPETGGGRTAAPYAYFLVDKSDYVLGCGIDGKKGVPPTDEKLANRLQLFTDKVAACYEVTKCEPLKSVLTFLKSVMINGLPQDLDKRTAAGELFGFRVRPERTLLVHQIPEVMDYWRRISQKNSTSGEGWRCLVTGAEISTPALFPQVKRVPGAQASAGVVSFNSPAFESYGWSKNANAPVSAEAGQAAAVALNRLLDPAFARQDGVVMPRLNKRLSEDTVVCFWAKEPGAEMIDDILEAEAQNNTLAGTIWQGVYEGKVNDVANPTRFYAMTLTGAQGRVIVRDYWESTVVQVRNSVAEYFRQLELPPNTPPAKGKPAPPHYRFRVLRECLTSSGRSEDLPGRHSAALFACAINEHRRFPDSFLPLALERMRAEFTRTDWIDSHRRDARTALIKAILIRNYPHHIMNNKEKQPGYLLGKLFACIERMQYIALGGDLNKNLAARYFAAASTTPRTVFVRLNEALVQHYTPKAMRKKGGQAFNLSRTIEGINEGLAAATDDQGTPLRLDLAQQGLFAIGYHVQRGEFFNWQPTEETISD